MSSYEALFAPTEDASAESFEALGEEEERSAKRLRSSYTVHVGPKFRDADKTEFQATNLHVIAAAKNKEQSLYEYIVDDVNMNKIRAYDNLDIMLEEYIHPESRRMISMQLKHMTSAGAIDTDMGDVPIPLYLCLCKEQIEDILEQLGFEHKLKDLGLIVMNKKRYHGKIDKIDIQLEQFVNQVVGRMARYKTKVDSTWDSQHEFFQPIKFKIRVGPRNSVGLDALSNIRRGNPDRVNNVSCLVCLCP